MEHLKSLTITTENTDTPENIESYDHIKERIDLRAYELYEKRGREDGRDPEDWFQAESEILPPNLKLELSQQGFRRVTA